MDFQFLLVAVNAKYIHSNPAIYSLRAYAGEELRQYVGLAEYTINQPMAEILADIYARKPDAIGFSCYIWNWRLVQELLGEIPKVLPGARIWLGGPEVTYDADVILRRYPWLSGIMVGEGEATFRELLAYYVKGPGGTGTGLAARERAREGICGAGELPEKRQNREATEDGGRRGGCLPESVLPERASQEEAACVPGESAELAPGESAELVPGESAELVPGESAELVPGESEGLQKIPGLCLSTGYTPCRPLTDMDSIPFLYDDLKPFENKILYYETSRGCPYQCSYCLSSIERQVRLRDIRIIERELQFFLDHNVKQVKFVDRTFNCDHKHTMAIWEYLQKHDNGVTNFHFEISADILREEEIALLNSLRPGLAQLEIGVQSVNPETLKAVRRLMDVERLERIVAAIHRGNNVHLHLDLIVGLPYEGYESFGKSFDRVYRMRPEQLQLGFLKVLKGSEMWERAGEYGICYLEQPPYEVLYTKWLSYEEVLRLKGIEEMVELYYNSCQFTHTLPFLEKAFPSPFALYEVLADFYREKKYFTASPARSYRYHVLLEFAAAYDGGRLGAYRELLTYDMYLRENVKSRPDFAPDIKDYKDKIKRFFQKEEREREYLPDYEGYDWKQLSKMAHLEPFAWPVWDIGKMTESYSGVDLGAANQREEGQGNPDGDATAKGFVLFDYRRRNPLTYEATVQTVNLT